MTSKVLGDSAEVAVVLPCYGQARFLPEALESLRRQTYPPSEVVVIDDGSPDDVAAAASPFSEARVIRQENRGLSAARNRGLEETTAPYLVFLDSDDRLLPHAIEANLRTLRARPGAAFSWGFNHPFRDDGEPVPWGPTSFRGEPSYARLLEANIVGAPVGVLFAREPLAEAGGFAEDLGACEDWDIYLRLARSHPFVCSHEIVADYRHHGDNMSGDPIRMYPSVLEVLRRQQRWVEHDPTLRAALARGIEAAHERWEGPARLEQLVRHLDARRWTGAAGALAGLLVRRPGTLVQAAVRTLKRG